MAGAIETPNGQIVRLGEDVEVMLVDGSRRRGHWMNMAHLEKLQTTWKGFGRIGVIPAKTYRMGQKTFAVPEGAGIEALFIERQAYRHGPETVLIVTRPGVTPEELSTRDSFGHCRHPAFVKLPPGATTDVGVRVTEEPPVFDLNELGYVEVVTDTQIATGQEVAGPSTQPETVLEGIV